MAKKKGKLPTLHCGACHKLKPVDQFYSRGAKKDGYQSRCILCYRAYYRDYYRRNAGHRTRGYVKREAE